MRLRHLPLFDLTSTEVIQAQLPKKKEKSKKRTAKIKEVVNDNKQSNRAKSLSDKDWGKVQEILARFGLSM